VVFRLRTPQAVTDRTVWHYKLWRERSPEDPEWRGVFAAIDAAERKKGGALTWGEFNEAVDTPTLGAYRIKEVACECCGSPRGEVCEGPLAEDDPEFTPGAYRLCRSCLLAMLAPLCGGALEELALAALRGDAQALDAIRDVLARGG
jgi:hypothetical protein